MSNTRSLFGKLGFVALLLVFVLGVWFIQALRQTPKTTTTTEETSSPPVYAPVIYAPSAWTASERLAAPFADGQNLMTTLGAAAVSEVGLDFDGKQAMVYRYHSKSEPPLYVVDSDGFFEINWYFAHAKDNNKEKQTSQSYAQKAYLLSTQIIGSKASLPLFEQMLAGKSPSLPTSVAYATCQHYACQLVFIKSLDK